LRLLPYSKALIDRRAAGQRPWLVVVTMGKEIERKLFRAAAFDGDSGVARIWVPDDFPIAQADLAWAIGLDVFVAGFCEVSRQVELMMALWRARVATLWVLDGKTEKNRLGQWEKNRAKFTGTRSVHPRRLSNGFIEFEATHRYEVPLDAGFRSVVESSRDLALIVSDPPLFDQPAFDSARAARMRELGAAA
jgi:hypothetical protein